MAAVADAPRRPASFVPGPVARVVCSPRGDVGQDVAGHLAVACHQPVDARRLANGPAATGVQEHTASQPRGCPLEQLVERDRRGQVAADDPRVVDGHRIEDGDDGLGDLPTEVPLGVERVGGSDAGTVDGHELAIPPETPQEAGPVPLLFDHLDRDGPAGQEHQRRTGGGGELAVGHLPTVG